MDEAVGVGAYAKPSCIWHMSSSRYNSPSPFRVLQDRLHECRLFCQLVALAAFVAIVGPYPYLFGSLVMVVCRKNGAWRAYLITQCYGKERWCRSTCGEMHPVKVRQRPHDLISVTSMDGAILGDFRIGVRISQREGNRKVTQKRDIRHRGQDIWL